MGIRNIGTKLNKASFSFERGKFITCDCDIIAREPKILDAGSLISSPSLTTERAFAATGVSIQTDVPASGIPTTTLADLPGTQSGKLNIDNQCSADDFELDGSKYIAWISEGKQKIDFEFEYAFSDKRWTYLLLNPAFFKCKIIINGVGGIQLTFQMNKCQVVKATPTIKSAGKLVMTIQAQAKKDDNGVQIIPYLINSKSTKYGI